MKPSPGFSEPGGSWEGIGVSVDPASPFYGNAAHAPNLDVRIDGNNVQVCQTVFTGEKGWVEVFDDPLVLNSDGDGYKLSRVEGTVELFWKRSNKRVVSGDLA